MGICGFRLDDITADMNWDNFNRIVELFDRYGVKPLLGVVPKNIDKSLAVGVKREDFWERMRRLQEQGYSLAQHGYEHQYETTNSGLLKLNPFSEFAGLSYEAQYEKIKSGKEILQNNGIYVTIFMAPGHTFDKTTLKALVENGFEYVTDGYSCYNYKDKGLTFIPSRESKPVLTCGVDTICLHTNPMVDQDFLELERFIQKNRSKVRNFSELLEESAISRRTLRVHIEEKKNLSRRRFKYFVANNRVLHRYLEETDDSNVKQKKMKRILGLPKLAVRLIKEQAK